MTRTNRVLLLVLAAVTLPLSAAESQVIERPPRVYRGLFGAGPVDANRWRHDVTITGNVLGGFDDNLTPTAGDGGTPGGTTQGTRGYLGYGAAQFAYSANRATKTFEIAARGFTNIFRGLGLDPAYGGEGSARVSTPMGERNTFSAFERYTDNPLFAPGVAVPPFSIDGPVAPASAPLANTTGYLVRRSQMLDGNLTLQRRVTRRTTIVIGGSHAAGRYEDGVGDSETVAGVFTYGRTVGQGSMLGASYNYSSSRVKSPPAPVRPLESHNVTLNYSVNHRLTPSRQLAISLGGGATQVNTISGLTSLPLSYPTPSGQANFRVDLTRSWNVAMDYSRGVSVIEGVSLDSFVTDNMSFRTGGDLGAHGDLAASVNWATGRAGAEGAGTYRSYTGILQMQFALNRWMDTMVSYTFYAYRLRGVITVTPGLANDLDRHAIRAGLTVRLPLYGQYVGRREGADN